MQFMKGKEKDMKKIVLSVFLSLVLLFSLTSCNKDAKKVTINFSETNVTMTVGETKTITPEVTVGKKVKNFELTYSIVGSSAAVDQNGNVTAVSAGTVLLVVTGNDKNATKAQVTITITKAADPVTYTVTFDANGGSSVASQTVTEGGVATEPAAPTKSGYTFNGWLLNGAAYNFATAVNANITLVASWTANQGTTPATYTVTFDANGGSSVASQTVTEGGVATEPAAPTKSGYTFSGWLINGVAYNFATPVNANITLVASWTANQGTTPTTYTVTFDANGGSSVASQTVEEGQVATEPTAPTKSGYTFNGWLLNGAAYSFATPVNANITLVASWTENSTQLPKFVVTFNSNGGSTVANQTIVMGQTATQPADPTKAGYIFAGWYTDAACTNAYNFSTPVNAKITLYAKWDKDTTEFTITFDAAGGTGVNTTLTFSDVANVTLPTPVKDGYTFIGWYEDGVKVDGITEYRDYNLVAEWQDNTTIEYTITYNPNGGTLTNSVTSYTMLDEVVLPTPTKSGYLFIGWYETASFAGSSVTKIVAGSTGNKVFYANWVEESTGTTVNLGYNLDGGYIVHYNDSREEMIKDFIADFKAYWNSAPTGNDYSAQMKQILDDGSNFFAKSWSKYDESLGYLFLVSDEYSDKWSWILNQMNDVRTARGEAVMGPTDAQAVARAEVQAFINGTNGFVYNNVVYEGNYSTYAVYNGWKEYVSAYLMTTAQYKEVAKNTAVLNSLPTVKKLGHTFAGWYTSADFADSSKVLETTTLATTTILYAKWVANPYFITYELNGGTNPATAPTEYTVVEGLNLPTPTKEGWNFVGWYMDAALTEKFVPSPYWAEDVNVYAKWEQNIATVTFDYNGGVSEELYIANGTEITSLKVNNYDHSNDAGGYFTVYTSDVFCYSEAVYVDAMYSRRFFIARDAETGFYKIVKILVSGDTITVDNKVQWPEGAEYAIVIADGYSGTGAANFISKNLVLGDILMIKGDITEATPTNEIEVSFYERAVSNSIISETLTTDSVVPVPVKQGHQFDGWFDEAGNKYTQLSDFTTDVTVTAKWTFNDKIIGAFEGESWVVVGEQINLSAEYAAGTEATFTWTSSTPSIATVADGVVTGVAEGVATIVVADPAYPDSAFTFYVTVLAEEPTGVVKLLTDSNNSSIFTVEDLIIGIAGAGGEYYADIIIGSVSKLLFEDYVVHDDYYNVNTSTRSTLYSNGIQFITFHYAADMQNSTPLKGGEALGKMYETYTSASWHYGVGNDGIWSCLSEEYGAWHAGTSKQTVWVDSGVDWQEGDPEFAKITLNLEDDYFYINGRKTTQTFVAWKDGDTSTYKLPLTPMGLGFKLVGNRYYITKPWADTDSSDGNSSYLQVASTGGNRDTIGIESSCAQGSDLWLTWQYSAQLCAKLLIKYNLPITQLVGHNFFSGKWCPQPMLEHDMEIWWEFIELVRQEMNYYKNYSNYSLTFASTSAHLDTNGRIITQPTFSQCVTYDVTYTTGSTTKTITLSSIIPGSVA